jgi:transposase
LLSDNSDCAEEITAGGRQHFIQRPRRPDGQSRQPQRQAVRQFIRSAGAKLFFLPKYSPDLNPIEQVFAKLKHLLRKAAVRTVDAVGAAIGDALEAFTSGECANYFEMEATELNAMTL